MAIGPNAYRWTVWNIHCWASDDIVVTNNSVTADAGQDQTICQNYTQLSANTPVTVATGTWTLIGGSGTFVNPNSPNTEFANIGLGNNYLRWTVTKANSNAYDDVIINNRMVVANAGVDSFICNN